MQMSGIQSSKLLTLHHVIYKHETERLTSLDSDSSQHNTLLTESLGLLYLTFSVNQADHWTGQRLGSYWM